MHTPEPNALTLALTKVGTYRGLAPRRPLEFHISREARQRYEFDEALYGLSGNVVLPNFLAVRVFAKKMNDKRDLVAHPEQAILPGQLNAMGLIDEILHYVAELYREEKGLQLFASALQHLETRLGKPGLDRVLTGFVERFPGSSVYKGEESLEAYLAGSTEGISHRELVLEEILLLWVGNQNRAFDPWKELFDDAQLVSDTAYKAFIDGLYDFFATTPTFGPDHQNLIDMLRAPAIAVPDSLHGQLQWIKERWGLLLGKFLRRLLSSLDFMREEERLFWRGGLVKSGYDSALGFGHLDGEPENFSADKEWMPKVILIAKSTLVWLDQLTKKYGREIRRLDQIPDEELDILAHRGFNSLWFIGLWERSKASKRIKQMCGNPDAEASAYSLFDYDIATELGGWEALNQLRERAWRRGIRVASDMVPNHTAMDSRWISDHPDYFLSLDYCPYPSYSFNGPDLSQDPAVEVKLEDHYYDRSDAAVVFRHHDRRNGRTRFIYHGNDGTSMPWNDTAQINYLNAEAREAVMQIILHVAKNFPIIRFDAAMTLAKKHIQRLWFPQPGSGGDIASRSEHGLTNEEFNKLIPNEFWREVVDRVAAEVPDTLLLAEAFWMMEGYFVRTLGMHRVYNSAFMHMFKKEENEKYRYTIKNTLEFDPEILKRYVNFMNNPDEETAAVQFGTGDKYFGVATMMVTMPGTPMFGHGQVEGFREKYGMEYRRAYWDEHEDDELRRRHEHEIFPLMHKRYLFAEVRNFYLYDLWTQHGHVNQNVFAYSNQAGHERALVLYNNAYDRAIGWIKTSAGYAVKQADGNKTIAQKDLGVALGLTAADNRYVFLREHNAGLWFIRRSSEMVSKGLYVELGGYQKQVFLDIHEVVDNDQGHYGRLCAELNGAGVEDIEEALKESLLRPLYQAFHAYVNLEVLSTLKTAFETRTLPGKDWWTHFDAKARAFFQAAKDTAGGQGQANAAAAKAVQGLQAALSLAALKGKTGPAGTLSARLTQKPEAFTTLAAVALMSPLGLVVTPQEPVNYLSRSLMDDWFLDRKIRRLFQTLGQNPGEAHHQAYMLRVLVNLQGWYQPKAASGDLLHELLTDRELQGLCGVNRYQEILYFNREGLEYTLWWLFAGAALTEASGAPSVESAAGPVHDLVQSWLKAAGKAEYQVEKLVAALGGGLKAGAKNAKAEAKTSAKAAPTVSKSAEKPAAGKAEPKASDKPKPAATKKASDKKPKA